MEVLQQLNDIMQVASVKAVREALDKVSLPAMLHDVPGGVANARVKAKIGVPKHVRHSSSLPAHLGMLLPDFLSPI